MKVNGTRNCLVTEVGEWTVGLILAFKYCNNPSLNSFPDHKMTLTWETVMCAHVCYLLSKKLLNGHIHSAQFGLTACAQKSKARKPKSWSNHFLLGCFWKQVNRKSNSC